MHFFVKERIDNEAQPENILQSVKVAFRNKYWLMTVVIQICCSLQLMFNLSISVYYLQNVVGNLALMGTYVTLSNLPGVIVMIVLPSFLHKVSKRNLAFMGTVLCLGAQIVFCAAPNHNISILSLGLLFPVVLGLPLLWAWSMPMTGDTIEYGEWKTGVRVQGVLFFRKIRVRKAGTGDL